jgi:catecholate siderophore receptor
VSLDLSVRFDLYDTSFSDSLAGTGFHRTDRAVSPKAALVYEPTLNQTYYASYTTSFDPAVSYLTLAADAQAPQPETAKTYELGTKQRWMGGRVTSTAAIFRIDSAHVTIADPDDPTLQEMPGSNQRVQGMELTTTGDITSSIDITVNYTFLDPEITASSIPGEVGKAVPNAARNVGNLWVLYEPEEEWQVGTGLNYVGHRYADALNTASIPGFVVWNAMAAWQINPRVHLQFNVQNITDAKYFTGAYFSDATENHVLPGQGRVFTVGTRFGF